jgi:CubicO group peptidase (beta-lactamase class C family)
MFRFLSFVVAALLLSAPISAQEKTGEIDKIFGWATPATPGCAVGVSLHGKVVVNRAYGSADLERDVPITPNTVFDAGSLVKQFVAAATLLLVDEGRLSLSEDVRKYVPELPDYGHKITLDHLLTHTSGLRDWTAMLPLADRKVDALTLTLRQRGLNHPPGEEWAYTNGGYVLLKEIVARTSGMTFAEFTRKRLFEPLGMKSTAYMDDLREVVKNRALAYDKENGRWKMAMLLDEDRGGGGALLTTTGDLLTWNDALTSGRLGAAVTTKLQEPATLNNGRKLGYARGLFLDANRGGKVVWHTGSAHGYKSFLSRYPEQGLSIAILCNSGDGTDRTAFARRIYELYVPGMRDEEKAPATAAANVDLKSREGLFFSEAADNSAAVVPLRLVVQDGRLRVAGGPALVAVTADRFRPASPSLEFRSDDDFELRFVSEDQLELKSMEGKTTKYRRAQPHAPAAADLQAFAGRYESDEIGSVVRVAAGPGGLVVSPEHSPSRRTEFKAAAPDLFHRGPLTLRFRRDKDGKIVALDYSSPLLRNIPFTRLSDSAARR